MAALLAMCGGLGCSRTRDLAKKIIHCTIFQGAQGSEQARRGATSWQSWGLGEWFLCCWGVCTAPLSGAVTKLH